MVYKYVWGRKKQGPLFLKFNSDMKLGDQLSNFGAIGGFIV
jgi:hypothetical protein